MILRKAYPIVCFSLLCFSCATAPPNTPSTQRSALETSLNSKNSSPQTLSSPVASGLKTPEPSISPVPPETDISPSLSPSACPFDEQEKTILRGQVLDKLTEEPLAGATLILRLGDQTNAPSLCPAGAFLAQVSTSDTGHYEVSAPVGFEINLVVSQVGYYPYKRVEVVNGRVGPTINLFDFYLTPSESEGFPADSKVPEGVFGAE